MEERWRTENVGLAKCLGVGGVRGPKRTEEMSFRSVPCPVGALEGSGAEAEAAAGVHQGISEPQAGPSPTARPPDRPARPLPACGGNPFIPCNTSRPVGEVGAMPEGPPGPPGPLPRWPAGEHRRSVDASALCRTLSSPHHAGFDHAVGHRF